jgi:hypothetical protein
MAGIIDIGFAAAVPTLNNLDDLVNSHAPWGTTEDENGSILVLRSSLR